VGSLFGELLAFQFADWMDQGSGFHLIEAGAHDGRLAADVLNWFSRHRPDLHAQLQYCILEPSQARQSRQNKTLAPWKDSVRWIRDWNEIPDQHIHGTIFSNELLDAFPHHRFVWAATRQSWVECGVGLKGDALVWLAVPPELALKDHPAIAEKLLSVLPDGFVTEYCPAAVRWWRAAARKLNSGRLLTLDYGLTSEEFFLPSRYQGTLRGYSGHRQIANPLANPGYQDLTAHVNFSELQQAGKSAGLQSLPLVSQAQFLTPIAARMLTRSANEEPWSEKNSRQLQSLIHPNNLGHLLKVLVQIRPQ